MYYFYILRSQRSGQYYLGSTKNLEDRLRRHNAGGVRSTKPLRPWEVLYFESFSSLAAANQREFQVKAWKSRTAIEQLINKNSSSLHGGPIV